MIDKYYITIPNTVWQSDIPDKAKILYGIIYGYYLNGRGEDYCWLKDDRAAAALGVSESSIQKYLNQLVEQQFIHILPQKKNKRTGKFLTRKIQPLILIPSKYRDHS